MVGTLLAVGAVAVERFGQWPGRDGYTVHSINNPELVGATILPVNTDHSNQNYHHDVACSE